MEVFIILNGERFEGYHLATDKGYLDYQSAVNAAALYVAEQNDSGHNYSWDAQKNQWISNDVDYVAIRKIYVND